MMSAGEYGIEFRVWGFGFRVLIWKVALWLSSGSSGRHLSLSKLRFEAQEHGFRV
jgi:hypothetical protein